MKIYSDTASSKLQLQEATESTDYDFDFYRSLVKDLDRTIDKIRDLYAEGDKAPATILHNLGYKDYGDHQLRIENEHNGKTYVQVFDFTDYDEDMDNFVIASVLVDDKVPQGWTTTKFLIEG